MIIYVVIILGLAMVTISFISFIKRKINRRPVRKKFDIPEKGAEDFIEFYNELSNSNLANIKRINKQEYKEKVISKIVKLIDENLIYYPRGAEELMNNGQLLNISNVENSDFFNFNICYFDDFINGKLENNITIRMANIRTEYETESNGETYSMKEFEGMFVEINTNKMINDTIHISQNNFNTGNIELDNVNFEKKFNVFTLNKILATRLLTHDLIEVLSKLYSKVKFEITIKQDKIYLRFFTGEMFEQKTYKNVVDKQLLYAYYYILKCILKVSEEINKAVQQLEI